MKRIVFTLLCTGFIAACTPNEGQQANRQMAENIPCPHCAKMMEQMKDCPMMDSEGGMMNCPMMQDMQEGAQAK